MLPGGKGVGQSDAKKKMEKERRGRESREERPIREPEHKETLDYIDACTAAISSPQNT